MRVRTVGRTCPLHVGAAAALVTLWAGVAGAQVTVRGTVVDSLAEGAPLAGAIVQLAPAASWSGGRTAISDADGAFRFDSVAPGVYRAGFFHPKLDSLGLKMPVRLVDVTASGAVLQLGVPSASTIVASLCRLAEGESTGLLLGVVRDAGSGDPLAGSSAVAQWTELVISNNAIAQATQRLQATTGARGEFAICDVPSDALVRLSATMEGDTSGFAELEVPPRGLLHRDVYLGRGGGAGGVAADAAAGAPGADAGSAAGPGVAVVVGTTVRQNGDPVPGALVTDLRSGAADTSDAGGRFRLGSLLPGTTTIKARAIGYRPARVSVDARNGGAESAQVVFGKKVDALLDRVTVFGEKMNHWDRDAFMRRMHSGDGTYLGMDEIEKRNALTVSDLLRGIPSVRIDNSRGGETILIRNCVPRVLLDGFPLKDGASTVRDVIAPVDIGGVEVYRSRATTPSEFSIYANGCGLVALWTKSRLTR